jgi:hypothetical protein
MAPPPAGELENEFDGRMFWICEECYRLFGVRPARFQALVSEKRGLPAAKILLEGTRDRRAVAWNLIASVP